MFEDVVVVKLTAATDQRPGFGQRFAGLRTAEFGGWRNRGDDLPATGLIAIEDDLGPSKRVVGGHQSLDGPVGKPDAQNAVIVFPMVSQRFAHELS